MRSSRAVAVALLVVAPAQSHADCVDLSRNVELAELVGRGGAHKLGFAHAIGDVNNDGVRDLVVSAYQASFNDRPNAGSVYVKLGPISSGTSIDLVNGGGFDRRFDAAASTDQLGHQLAIGDLTGDGIPDLVIGAPFADSTGDDAGKVYVVPGPIPSGPTFDMASPPVGTRTFHGGTLTATRLGTALAIGDLNGDGGFDLVIGAQNKSTGGVRRGAAYVVFGGGTFPAAGSIDLSAAPTGANYDTEFLGAASGDELGSAVAIGDVAGSATPDLLLGAPDANSNGRTDAGAAYLILGSTTFPTGSVDLSSSASSHARFYGSLESDRLGQSIATGDLDGSGTGDIAIAAPGGDATGRSACGAVYVVLGSATLASGDRDFRDPATFATKFFGAASGDELGGDDDQNGGLAIANVDGSGPVDLLMGAPEVNGTAGSDTGAVYLVLGSTAFVTGSADLLTSTNWRARIDGGSTFGDFGERVTAADLDGDGAADVLSGARAQNPTGGNDAGAAYVKLGSATLSGVVDLSNATAQWDVRVFGAASGDSFGAAMAAGDFDGGGKTDLAIGAPLATVGDRPGAGAVYVWFGESFPSGVVDLGLGGVAPVVFHGAAADDDAGRALFAADVNADGAIDLIIGAPDADPAGRSAAGTVYVVFGGGGVGGFPTSGTFDLSTAGDVTLQGHAAGVNHGRSFAVANVVTASAADDVVVGAPGRGPTNGEPGYVFVLAGPLSAGTADLANPANYHARYAGNSAPDDLGMAVAAGDLTGDGVADLAIGARADNTNTFSDNGTIYVIAGPVPSGTVVANTVDLTELRGDQTGSDTGETLVIGRFTNDAAPDLAIGSPEYDPVAGRTNAGSVYVIAGGAGFPTGIVNLEPAGYGTRLDGAAISNELGSYLAAGDVNGDGFDELFLGTPSPGRTSYMRTGGSAFAAGVRDLGSQPENGGSVFSGPTASDVDFASAIVVADLTGTPTKEVAFGARAWDANDADGQSRTDPGGVWVIDGGSYLTDPPGCFSVYWQMDYARTNTTMPYLSLRAFDPRGGTLQWEVQWSEDPAFASGVTTASSETSPAGWRNVTSGSTMPPFTPGDVTRYDLQSTLLDGRTYWWRARAKGAAGVFSAYTTPYSFTVDTSQSLLAWHATTTAQFDRGNKVSVSTASDEVKISSGTTGEWTAPEVQAVYFQRAYGRGWGRVLWSRAGASGTIDLDINDGAGNAISGYQNLTTPSVDISALSVTTYPVLEFEVDFSGSTTSPILLDLTVDGVGGVPLASDVWGLVAHRTFDGDRVIWFAGSGWGGFRVHRAAAPEGPWDPVSETIAEEAPDVRYEVLDPEGPALGDTWYVLEGWRLDGETQRFGPVRVEEVPAASAGGCAAGGRGDARLAAALLLLVAARQRRGSTLTSSSRRRPAATR